MRRARHVARVGEMRNAYILVGKREGKRPHVKYSCRWEDFVRMGFSEIGLEVVEWIHLARNQWLALVNTLVNLLASEVLCPVELVLLTPHRIMWLHRHDLVVIGLFGVTRHIT
jgi:hypothetical protein